MYLANATLFNIRYFINCGVIKLIFSGFYLSGHKHQIRSNLGILVAGVFCVCVWGGGARGQCENSIFPQKGWELQIFVRVFLFAWSVKCKKLETNLLGNEILTGMSKIAFFKTLPHSLKIVFKSQAKPKASVLNRNDILNIVCFVIVVMNDKQNFNP